MFDSDDDSKYLDLLKEISKEVKETRDSISFLDKKIDLNIQRTEYELKAINKLDEHQNELLAEHIAGVNTLKGIFESTQKVNEARLEKLETPGMVLKGVLKGLGVAGAIGTAIAGILKLIPVI